MATGQYEDKGLIALTGLYLGKAKGGTPYFSGRLGLGKVFVFKNKSKKKDTDPDYMLVIGEWKQAEGGARPKDDDPVPF